MVAPWSGTKGQTSVRTEARMSAAVALHVDPLGGDLDRPEGGFEHRVRGPTKVMTVRWVSAPGSTSSRLTPVVDEIAVAIASIVARLRPSEKLGTHSMSGVMAGSVRPGSAQGKAGAEASAC